MTVFEPIGILMGQPTENDWPKTKKMLENP